MMHTESEKLNILIFIELKKISFGTFFCLKTRAEKNHSDQETLKKYFSQRNHFGQF